MALDTEDRIVLELRPPDQLLAERTALVDPGAGEGGESERAKDRRTDRPAQAFAQVARTKICGTHPLRPVALGRDERDTKGGAQLELPRITIEARRLRLQEGETAAQEADRLEVRPDALLDFGRPLVVHGRSVDQPGACVVRRDLR